MKHQNVIPLSSIIIILILATATFTSCNQEQQTPDGTEKTTAEEFKPPVESGQELYIAYCAICHGEGGKGDGAYAELLTSPPGDLTMITEKYNGEFPTELLKDVISGEARVDGHGSDMPVWAETFRKGEDLETRQEVDAKIAQLVTYIRSLQSQ